MRLLIQHGQVVDPVQNTMTPLDLYIENGLVAQIGTDLQVTADQVIDASQLVVAPALVDLHVHLRDPGQTEKEDIHSGALAAARGGVATLACMANTSPPLDTPEQIRYVVDKARDGCGVRVLPLGAVTRGLAGVELTDAGALVAAGAVGISDDGSNVDSALMMRRAMQQAKALGITLFSHCEDSSLAKNLAVNEGNASKNLWMEGRPAIAEELMVMRDVMLAEETGARVHICHVSTGKSVDIIRKAKRQNIPVTCETCPHYFVLTEDEVVGQGPLARVNPPLRTKKDLRAIANGIKDGTIDAIATDHAPHTMAEKSRPLDQAPSGMVGLETSLALSLTALYHSGKVYLPQLFRALSTKPAEILGTGGGQLAVGKIADLVIFDANQEWAVNPDLFASKGKNSPYRDYLVRGRVKYTIVDGKIIFQEGPGLPEGVEP